MSSPKSSRPSRSRPARAAAPRASYHHGDLRNALIAAALALIAEHGVEGFTLRDCARKAGVSVAAPYRHFTERDDLLAAVAADCMVRLGEAMDRAIEAAGTDDPLAVFRATGIAYVRFAVEHPAHFRVMNMPQVVARTPPEVREQVDAWGREMTGKLAAAQQAGAIAQLPLDEIMLAATCVTHGLAHMIVDGVNGLDEIDPDTAAKLAIAVTGVLGEGLLPRTGADAERAKAASIPPGLPKRKPARGGRTAIVLAVIALAGGRAEAKAGVKPMIAAAEYRAAEAAGEPPRVLVEQLPVKPGDGTYVLIGAHGPIGVLALDNQRTGPRPGCPYYATFHLIDAPASVPAAGDPLAVIGPIDPDPGYAHARIMRLAADDDGPAEPLGGALPRGVEPSYAIDLDGDAAADLVLDLRGKHGPFVRGMAKIKLSAAIWQRRGKRWSRTAQCRWTENDFID